LLKEILAAAPAAGGLLGARRQAVKNEDG